MNTEKWAHQIDQITDAFIKEFGTLTDEQLNWKPNEQTWSIAQNMDHLIVINETYYPAIRQIRENKYKLPWMSKIRFIPEFFGKTVLNAVQPDRKKKMKTFSIWEPSYSVISGDIMDRFQKHQSELKRLITESQDLLEKGTMISSPANRYIVYKLETAFDIIVTHEMRHFQQAREVCQMQHT